jgi:hypothetical protein
MAPCDGERAVTADVTSGTGFATVLNDLLQIGESPSCESDTRAIVYRIIAAGTEIEDEQCENLEQEDRESEAASLVSFDQEPETPKFQSREAPLRPR